MMQYPDFALARQNLIWRFREWLTNYECHLGDAIFDAIEKLYSLS